MPDPLVGRPIVLAGPEAADVADAERAILELDRSAKALANTEALARLLLRAESVNSSKIEGLEVSPRRLLRADAARAHGEEPTDVTATEVLGNIDAMNYAIDAINRGKTFSLDLLREVHRRLLASTPLVKIGGIIRTTQNWIGGSSYNPCSASYVPPPPELVHDLLIDLCDFCNGDELPVVVQAALAHAQFEAIHPFADGNGRVGRAIIHMVFRRRRLTASITPPVSLVLATMSKDYVAGLNAMCYRGAPTSAQAVEGFNRWIATFASACSRAVADSFIFERRINDLKKESGYGGWGACAPIRRCFVFSRHSPVRQSLLPPTCGRCWASHSLPPSRRSNGSSPQRFFIRQPHVNGVRSSRHARSSISSPVSNGSSPPQPVTQSQRARPGASPPNLVFLKMSSVRVLVGTRKGAFILDSDAKRNSWRVSGPHFAGWEIYHVKGSPVDPNRLYASQSSSWSGQVMQRSDDGGATWEPWAISSSTTVCPARISGTTARRIRGSSRACGISNPR